MFLKRVRKQTALLAWGIEKRSHVEWSETGELGEKVLNERSEFRNLTPILPSRTKHTENEACVSFSGFCEVELLRGSFVILPHTT
ncbi:hypothetical protein A3D62_03090 [Candidatus Kaiserbacteria bacterium RIFCSPHIGHO2_02_FULL_49_11]|uniref:Uncharacterized protein n=1 Tax=Candidatus Kaiserbacteria bacterium RIFCSPHIGHO2_02_FULL_49_11 TaxID=1798489 RepID=A0A1F6D1T5_9BACT|nr:MAG: hypothetical protein A3D62_03090 [Candidatus Kaiserbacteria bacterium RIFCSPHIGHO2_02_FULL_49_11]